jgi:fluoride exporter
MDETPARLVALVAAGGALGSVLRYGVTGVLTTRNFPWGTFAVNFTGTFLLCALFFSFLQSGVIPPDARTFLFLGVFGGFTTFSTFGLETVSLFSEGQIALAAVNVALNAGVCLLGAFAGRAVGLLWGGV